MESCAFIDIFTTQNDLYGKNNCPIQFGCEIFNFSEVIDHDIFFNPKRRKLINIIPDEDILIPGYINSGYKNEDVKAVNYNGIELKDALKTIYKYFNVFKERNFFVIGYNHIHYDLEILNKNFKRVLNLEPIVFPEDHLIDVMKMAEYTIPIDLVGSYSMESVITYFSGDYQKVQKLKMDKSTITDIKITKMIFQRINKYQSFSDLMAKINEPREISIMPFGKYKGAYVSEMFNLDIQYCNWLIKNKDISKQNPNLVNTLKKMLNTIVE